jgi:hypothetical protein
MTKENTPDTKIELKLPVRPEAQVIIFPKSKIVRMPVEPNTEVQKEKSKRRNADNIISELCNDIVNELGDTYDVDITEMSFQKDFSYAIEVLRAAIYRTANLPHPFHEYIDNYVQVTTKEEMQALIEQQKTNPEIESEPPEASA